MEKSFYYSILFLLFTFTTIAQNKEIKTLKLQKVKLNKEIGILQDSVKSIDAKIHLIESQNFIEIENEPITKIGTLNNTTLFDEPYYSGNQIGNIPKHVFVEVFKYNNGFWLVSRDSLTGYVSEDDIGMNMKMRKIVNNNNLVALTEKYGEKIANKLNSKRIWIGMSTEMAVESIGKPKDKNKSVGSWGTHEQWIYDDKYLYFENGKLKSWQEQ